MSVLVVLLGSAAGLGLAYVVLGRWLSHVFGVDANAVVPSIAKEDGQDFVPTRRWVVFAHHFTSIAGTGPIVGPAVAVFWGWLPALVWVLVGSVLVGAVHDFGSLVVSLKNGGATVGEAAGRLISPRARWLFLSVLWLALTVVLGVFGLVIASVFGLYPESVLPVWAAMPLAILLGRSLKSGGSLTVPVVGGLAILLGCVWLGATYLPVDLAEILPAMGLDSWNPVVVWTVLLLAYCYAASVMPVGLLLQPRDLLNSGLLFLTMAALVVGAGVAGVTGDASLDSAPMIVTAEARPFDAPAILPFLFVTVACGACSGFHCLVASGTSSKQVKSELDARPVGYGAMLCEAFLAVLVILACTAGLGMNAVGPTGEAFASGRAAWEATYVPGGSWASFRLPQMIGAFVAGGANFLQEIGIPAWFGVGLIATTVAGFAATTLDSATRLQRYVVQELAGGLAEKAPIFSVFTGRHPATLIAVLAGGAIALIRAPGLGYGTGGLILWPLFGATNQLLAGLAFLVIAFYLHRRRKPVLWLVPAALLMVAVPAWAMAVQVFAPETGWIAQENWLLTAMGVAVLLLEGWVLIEAVRMWPRVPRAEVAPSATAA
ncbi:carbon starvation CstA family protein [Alienimonas californiensis]|uniref:Carbon starvation protein A n=1 Tax=Alienimonas californiensis TaxID=2527989 RepID=A0A517P977_9PLAN|nr:carbon starvation CstA family protein [Alienimonas californiensis]QDT15927.1 Carbon starvation protein A [Alienimonas californiensis]